MIARPDVSEWLIHFVHDRDPLFDERICDELDMERPAFRFTAGKPEKLDCWWRESDDAYPIEPDGSACQVLFKILHDGHIRAGWAWRNGIPTVYGQSPAVCMTEMPLSSMVTYSKSRGDANRVATYGIALPKREVFRKGARPVIYGLTNSTKDVSEFPRLLDPASGIGESEQYRFVRTRLGDGHEVDWTHEREWRWAHPPKLEVPGLSLWLDATASWSNVVVIVSTDEEEAGTIDFIRLLADRGGSEYEHRYCLTQLERVRVLSLERVKSLLDGNQVVRIEDIPLALVKDYHRIELTDAQRRAARKAVSDVSKKISEYREEYLKIRSGYDLCGFAYVSFYTSEHPFCEALIKEGLAHAARAGYDVSLPIIGSTQDVSEVEYIAEKCASQLNSIAGTRLFWMRSILD